MIVRKRQAHKGVGDPHGAGRAAVVLDLGGKGTVIPQTQNPLIKALLTGDKLEQGSRGDAPGKARIRRGLSQEEIGGQRRGGRASVDAAPAPHGHMGLPVKELRERLCQPVCVRLDLSRQPGLLLIAVPLVPQRAVHVKGPGAVIVKEMPVPIPAVPCVVGDNHLGVIPHHIPVNGVALPVQEGQDQHIEKAPVVVACVGMAELGEVVRDPILLLFRAGIPHSLRAHGKSDG